MDTPSFERSALEADMRTLAAEIRSQREQKPEMGMMGGQELVKEALRVFPEFSKNQQVPQAAVPVPQATDANASSPLPAYAQNAPAEVKLEIEYLIDIALRKGVGPALAEAGKSPFFVQDAFHDALAGRLYPELKKEGIVD